MSVKQHISTALRKFPIARFYPATMSLLKGYSVGNFTSDLSAGLTVGIVALPLAMAFAIASGLTPEAGIYTAIFAGFLISLFGGCKVQIGGPAGAFIVIVYGIIAQYGVQNLLIATFMSGIFLFLMGLFKIGSFIRFIPVSTVIGFTNGIAVLIGLSQVKDFLGLEIQKMPADFFSQIKALYGAINTINPYSIGLGAASLLIVFLWPRTWTASSSALRRWMAHIPSTIIVLVIMTSLVTFFHLPVETIGSRFGGIPQSLPTFVVPELSLESFEQLIRPALTLALLGAIESLLCARVADSIIHDRHDPNQELMGQGIANCVVPFFGCMPSTGTIARTVTNIKSGAVSPVAGIIHALTLLVIVLAAAPLAANVPLCCLSAILLFMAFNMGNWYEFIRLRQFTMSYKATLLATFFLTVIFDLTVAVEVGLAVASLFFMYRMNTLTRVLPITLPPDVPEKVQAWLMEGALFFGSISKLEAATDPKVITSPDAPDVIIFDFRELISLDNSAGDIIEGFQRNLAANHKVLIIANATDHPLQQLKRLRLDTVLGKYLAPDMESALLLAREALEEIRVFREKVAQNNPTAKH
ncbi:SulP family inorganic anion transporter [Oxalobacter sp. OxGP1]|uniref:SulP family inorganic anion transporter n=1 Tax=Oxalobacter paeniformigenes TaxID=2946594 RepID=UPI0022AE7800|nr:SulP family inorganic anion transporter [Oxalobacter paeniformigenes]MCZ4052333.1 SulP family inorganic anion transporter [Oxalobacter paeniformigenes]